MQLTGKARVISLVIPLFVLLICVASPLSAAQASDPSFVSDGSGADVSWWNSSSSYQANWGASNFAGSLSGNFYSYELNQSSTDIAASVVTSGQQLASANPPTSITLNLAPTLVEGQRYYFWVQAVPPAGFGQTPSNWVRSNGFMVDTLPPVVTITSPTSAFTTTPTIAVSWSGSDATSGLASYDVQYQADGGAWTSLLTHTALVSTTFAASNGHAYAFQVRATDNAGNTSAWVTSTKTTVNVFTATLALSSIPSSLSFGGTDTAEPVDLTIQAKGGSVTVTGVRESRTYSSWPREDGPWENLSLSLASGASSTVSRTVNLSVLQRSRALGGGSTGTFNLILDVRGTDGSGNPVETALTVPVSVSSAPPSTLTITNVSLEIPASPYNLNDVVKNARVHLTASGTGTATGQVLVDGSLSWSGSPSFSVSVSGDTAFDVLGNLPTGTAGSHTVRVEISSPASMHADVSYTVSASPPSFPPSALDLIKGVAQLSGLAGSANATIGAGYTDFTFSGSAAITLLSLASLKLPGVTVSGLVVRVFDNLSPPEIRGGTVEIAAGGSSVLTTFADGFLKIKRVAFDFGKASDHLSVDAAIAIPYAAQDLFTAKDLILDATGITDVALSWDQSKAQSFTLFGMTFSIHDVLGGATDGTKALAFGKAGKKGYYIGISGAISFQQKQGVSTSTKDLATFRNDQLRFYTDGSLDGNITLASPYDLIPKELSLQALAIAQASKSMSLTLSGILNNLPAPLDKVKDLPVSFTMDVNGNGSVSLPLIKKLEAGGKGHALLGKTDTTEWDLGLATLNLTWLSLDLTFSAGVLDLDHSQVTLAVDLYLDLLSKGGGKPSDDDKRISFGDLDSGGALKGGIVLGMDGSITWPAPTHLAILKDKELAFGPVDLTFAKISIVPSPFALVITGSIAVDLDAISGGINFDNLKIGLDGTISDVAAAVSAGGGGALSVLDALSIAVDSVAWSDTPTTITIDENTSTGSGASMTLDKQSNTINVDSYFSMKGASISLGSGSDSVMSGGFDELTVYSSKAGTGLIVRKATLSLSGTLDVTADMEYSPSPTSLRFAGSVSLPDAGIDVAAVGKVGTQGGKPSFGVFLMAEISAGIPVGPGVLLTEVGGGFFVNPSDDDIAMVRNVANFKRPELNDEIAARRPGGTSNSQSFALMILGGLSVVEKDLVSGRALVTVTSSYFNLDAEVSLASGLAEGKAYLAISWNPGYAEGKITATVGFPTQDSPIVSGGGDMDFYFYPGVWGIDGKMQVKILGIATAEGDMFVGSPGFMVSATVSAGIDLGIVSGSVSLNGMFWYYEPKNSLGAYAAVDLKGDFLAGLFSAEAGLEGAMILLPSPLMYTVGSLSVDVLGITVFDGSLWFSVSPDGLDGGTGRNSQYDSLIAEARDMAHALKAAKDSLAASLEAARLQLAQLSDEQAKLAGLVLTEQQKTIFGNVPVDVAFDQNESTRWGASLPGPMAAVHDVLFGPQAKALVTARAQLMQTRTELDSLLTDLEKIRKDVSARLAGYEDILVENLPSVQDVGKLGNPFGGMLQKTVTVGKTTKTVKSGFVLDSTQADAHATSLTSLRESFAQYQEAFIETAGGIDARLQKLDEILFQGDANLTGLNERFARIHSELSSFTDQFVQFQGQSIAWATNGQQTVEAQLTGVQDALNAKAAALKSSNAPGLADWNKKRIDLVTQLVAAGDPKGSPYAADTNVPQDQLFTTTGYELWYHMPDQGFIASVDASQKAMPGIITSFSKSSAALLKNWGDSTDLTDQVFQRKADLYGILYEIYDQLANYGSGKIGIASDGNAAGFKGVAALGLSFRVSALSKAVSGKGTQLPAGALPPSSPTFGPNRPLQNQLKSLAPSSGFLPRPDNGEGAVPLIGAVFAASKVSLSSVRLQEVPNGMPANGALDRSVISIPAAVLTPVAWVSITTYFSAKRAEIAPYLVIPQVTMMNGNASSSSELESLLHATFDATHPVGVVEFEYRVSPIATGPGPGAESLYKSFFHTGANVSLPTGLVAKAAPSQSVSVQASSAISLYSAAPAVKSGGQVMSVSSGLGLSASKGAAVVPMTAALKAAILSTTPWLSVGGGRSLDFLFIPQIQDPGTYSLEVKIRGAGGRTIVRQGRFTVAYATPGGKIPVTSGMDTSDTTPPTTPAVTLGGAATASKELLYAKWSSNDPESGIQGYQYAVEEYTDVTAKAATGAVATAPPPQQKGQLVSKVLSPKASTTSTTEFFASGPLVSAQEAASHAWVDAQGRTEANIRGLSLAQGKQYVVWVMATNGVGRASIGRSDPIVVDAVPPAPPKITAFQQASADGHPNSLSFTFTPGTDAVSGIAGHSFAVGTSDKDEKLWPWTVAQGTAATIVNLPLAKGQQVTLKVKAVSGAGLESVTTQALSITYAAGAPPVPPTVVADPPHFTSDTTQLSLSWSAATDTGSGIVAYEYAVGTSSTKAEAWTPASASFTPYLLGQGPQGSQGPAMKVKAAATLTDKGTYYALVRATNGNGLMSVGASLPVVVDLSPPTVTLTGSAQSPGTDRLVVDVKAGDPVSGVARYRAKVWEVKGLTSMTNDRDVPFILVMGWSSQGTFQGTMQSKAAILAPPALGSPWLTTDWQPIGAGAPPSQADIQVVITGFPAKGLQVGKSYQVAVEVENGAGVVAQSDVFTVTVVGAAPTYKFAPRFNYGGK
jgi:hypothetical protein